MNAPAAVAQLQAAQIKPGQTFIIGRCTLARKAGESFLHLVVLPAADEYSSPATVEIISKQRFAAAGDDVRILCRIGGFRRQYKVTDKETGEVRTVTTADNKFFAVEG